MTALRSPRPRRSRARSRLLLAGRALELVCDAAALLLRLRDRPRPLDWIALGAYGAGLAHRVWTEGEALRGPDPAHAFPTDGPNAEWAAASPVFAVWMLEHARQVESPGERVDAVTPSCRLSRG
jgi:hypothetical protein